MSELGLYTYTIIGEPDVQLLARVAGILARYDVLPDSLRMEVSSQGSQPTLNIKFQTAQTDIHTANTIAARIGNIVGVTTVDMRPPSLQQTENTRPNIKPPQPTNFSQIEGACGLYAVEAVTQEAEIDIIQSFHLAAAETVDWSAGFSMSVVVGAISNLTGQRWVIDSGSCQYSPRRSQSMTVEDFLMSAPADVLQQCILQVTTRLGGHIVAVVNGQIIDNAYPDLVRPYDRVGPCVKPLQATHA